jgi:hypothetical protein
MAALGVVPPCQAFPKTPGKLPERRRHRRIDRLRVDGATEPNSQPAAIAFPKLVT